MADNGHNHQHRRHGQPPARMNRRRRVLLIALAVLIAGAVAAALIVTEQDRPSSAVLHTPAARTTTAPISPPTTTPAAGTTDTATTSEIPRTFVDAMSQIGIPLDPHTGWAVAQGICIRLGQPEYDQFRLAEGIERLFPSVTDEQAHAFVAIVAASVCHS